MFNNAQSNDSVNSSREHVKILVEGALCIALSIVLSRLKLFTMPQGGSIDFGLVPLILFSYRRGMKRGIIAGASTGILKILLGGYVYNPAQAILDYPLSYLCVGFSGLKNHKISGLIIAAICQTACSVLSGVLFFSEYAPEGQSPLIYSLLYNVPIFSVEYIISGIAAMLIWKSLEKVLP